ncbi:hypothetical protein GCM10023063_15950 [Arthrobacter methylotrophus]|uniref:Uncharacterized protein n=2 Tax=Arthrobacter methylotrophus TaxID=121291 RepID=A0ABV5UQA9_9MICC
MTAAEYLAFVRQEKDPFKLRVFCRWQAIRLWDDENPEIREEAKQFAATAKTLVGVCQLRVDLEWNALLRAQSSWKRRKFVLGREAWWQARLAELEASAEAELAEMAADWVK